MRRLWYVTLSLYCLGQQFANEDQVTYDHTFMDALRKPFTIFAGLVSVFFAAWALGNIDVSIKKR